MSDVKFISEELKPAVEEFEKIAKESTPEKGVAQHFTWTSPAVIGLFIAALGLVGNFWATAYNDNNTRKLGIAKLHSDLILQAVNTHSLQESCQNLLFFINSDLIVDTKGKITQQCTHPLQQTYIPALAAAGGAPAVAQDMAVTVKRSDVGAKFSYAVAFTVPNVPDATFNMVKIYCTQLAGLERTGEKAYPSLQGNWKPGDRVTFDVQVSKELANSSKGWNLTFCVGSDMVCFPSPNLLLFNNS
jgi:hypothetical protein